MDEDDGARVATDAMAARPLPTWEDVERAYLGWGAVGREGEGTPLATVDKESLRRWCTVRAADALFAEPEAEPRTGASLVLQSSSVEAIRIRHGTRMHLTRPSKRDEGTPPLSTLRSDPERAEGNV